MEVKGVTGTKGEAGSFLIDVGSKDDSLEVERTGLSPLAPVEESDFVVVPGVDLCKVPIFEAKVVCSEVRVGFKEGLDPL